MTLRAALSTCVTLFAFLLILPPEAKAQRCLAAGSSAQFCNEEGATCSPPNGGTCRQVRDRNGTPDGCVCSAIADERKLFIMSSIPEGRFSTLNIILMIALGLALLLALALYRKRAKPHEAG